MLAPATHPCPLCGSTTDFFHRDQYRTYFQCSECELVSIPEQAFLSLEDEKSRYDLHQNSPEDQGYRRFLGRMLDPIMDRLKPGSTGLDFGAGPGPTLSLMFEERGYPMGIFDPFYAPNTDVLDVAYDFVVATEVVEHLRTPATTLEQMWDCVRPGGLLGIMTKRVIDKDAFSRWHYKNDDTHICFFSERTFHWLAAKWHTTAEFIGPDVVLMRKKSE